MRIRHLTAILLLICSPVFSQFERDSTTLAIWRFDEGTGSSFKNEVGGAGTLYGKYEWVDGRFGKAVKLDGATAYGNCNIAPPSKNATYEVWYKPTDLAKNTGWITMGWGSYNAGFAVAKDSISMVEFKNRNTKSGTTEVFTNGLEWYYLVFVISDDTTLQALYVNGKKVASLQKLHDPIWNSLWIGVDRTNGYSGFNNGIIDEIRISNTPKTSVEVEREWNKYSGHSGFIADSSTVGLWRFDDGSGTEFKNEKGGSGSLFGNYKWVDGRFGKAIKLDGSTAYGNFNIVPPSRNTTYEVWYKPDSLSSNSGWIFMGWGSYNAGIVVYQDSITLVEYKNPDTKSGTTRAFYNGVDWYYLTFVISDDSSLQALYVNGEKIARLETLHNPNWNSLWLGVDRTTGYKGFNNGTIDEFRISNRARTQEEIRRQWASGSSTSTVPMVVNRNRNTILSKSIRNESLEFSLNDDILGAQILSLSGKILINSYESVRAPGNTYRMDLRGVTGPVVFFAKSKSGISSQALVIP